MTENQSTTEPKRRRRWVMPLLFVSLAVNLLIIGVVAGAVMQRGDRDNRTDGPARSILGAPYIRALETEDRRTLGREIIQNRDRLRENRDDLKRRVEGILDELRSPDFDRGRLSELLDEQRRLAVSRQEFGEDLLLDRIEAMSPEDRRAYADRLGDALSRFRRN